MKILNFNAFCRKRESKVLYMVASGTTPRTVATADAWMQGELPRNIINDWINVLSRYGDEYMISVGELERPGGPGEIIEQLSLDSYKGLLELAISLGYVAIDQPANFTFKTVADMIDLLIAHLTRAGMSHTDARRYAHSLMLMLPMGNTAAENMRLFSTLALGLDSAARELKLSIGKSLGPDDHTGTVIQWS